MPDVMDELRIEITAESKKADDKIDDLCNKIEKLASSLGGLNGKKPTGLQDLQKATEGVSKAATDLASKYKDLGKGFELKGSTQYLQKQVDNLSNALARATLKKNELEMSGSTGGQMYEYAVRDVIKYENQIESLKNQLASISETKLSPELELKLSNLEQAESQIKEIVEETPRVVEVSTDSLGYNQQAIEFIENYSERAKTSVQSLAEKLSELTVPEVRTDNIDKLTASIEKTEAKLEELRNKLSNALVMGTVTESVDDSGYVRLQEQIALTEKQLEAFREKKAEVESTPSTGLDSFQSKISKIGASLSKVASGFARFASGIKSVLAKIASLGKSILKLNKHTKGLNTSLSGGLKHLLAYGLGIRSLYALFGKLRNAIKEGIKNLVQFDSETNASISLLTNSLTQLKNATAAAASPLLNALAPALNTIIQWCVSATNAVNQLIAALTGKSTWIKAKTLTDDYASSIKNASKDAKRAVASFDALNIINSQSGDSDFSTSAEDMFEEVPIESNFFDFANKIKNVLSKLFDPLQEAWKRKGEFVMDSWKYALKEIGKLAKDVGEDFLEVWNQEETINIFENILSIIGDIGLSAGNLASNFRSAWNENDTGLHILENIRDIIGVIINNIKSAADATVEWTEDVDFSALLTKIEEWTESLTPVFDNLSGILTDFYTEVLLPLGQWVLEEGLPDLLQVFIDFNNKVDWEKLRTNLAELWEHLEPFAERVGEGLIDFIEDVSDALADFLNSEEFENFLKEVEDWMDNVDAEDAANGIKNIALALIVLKTALLGFQAIKTVTEVLTTVKTFLSLFGLSGIGGGIAKVISGAGKAIGGVVSGLGSVSSSVGSIGGGVLASISTSPGMVGQLGMTIGDLTTGSFLDSRIWDNWYGEWSTKASETVNKVVDWIGENIILGIFEWFAGKIEESIEDFKNVFNWDDTIALFTDAKERFKEAFSSPWIEGEGIFSEEIGENILLGIIEGFEGACGLIAEPVRNFFDELWDNICERFGIHSPATAMESIGKNILLGVIEGFKGAFDSISNVIEKLKNLFFQKFTEIKNTVLNIVSNIVSGIVEKINDALSLFGTFEEKISKSSVLSKGKSIVSSVTSKLSISGYATGGFPSQYSLFMAGENGVPEIAGTIGGKTAVAGGAEITGISDTIRSTSSEEIALLKQQNALLQAILEKEYGISSSGLFNAVKQEYQSEARRQGASRVPVWG